MLKLFKKEKAKKNKKTEKKVLTRENRCGIILRLSQKKAARWSLKIEQQEISTKRNCKCENTNLVERVIYTQQSKRS